jgi:hypothetical protein
MERPSSAAAETEMVFHVQVGGSLVDDEPFALTPAGRDFYIFGIHENEGMGRSEIP